MDSSTKIRAFYTSIIILFALGCKKIISIPPPVSTVSSSQVFSSDDQVKSAVAGIYDAIINSHTFGPFNGSTTIYCGAYADEFTFFDQFSANNVQFQNSLLLTSNPNVNANFWTPVYSYIYDCNAVIEGLQISNPIDDSLKTELLGECEFIRSLCYFYLVNLFGDVPFVTSTNYNNTSLLTRTSASEINQSIIGDLIDAKGKLAADFTAGKGQRIIPNKWAATALLSRAYLFAKDWANAETQSSEIINNSNLFSLSTNLNDVFSPNSTEAIWQLQQDNANFPFNATPEGDVIIPSDSNSQPFIYLTPSLLSSFEPSDNRRAQWIDSTNFLGTYYFYPFKYKIGNALATASGSYTEYYMVLRLAEQFLIRAEARAHQNEPNAIDDLNTIRNRAGLLNYTGPATGDSLLSAIAHERQIELFGEWGHRWLDLRRTGQASNVLGPLKPKWTSNALLFPIPVTELKRDPNLTQNPGYN
jgi:hypothetical protein